MELRSNEPQTLHFTLIYLRRLNAMETETGTTNTNLFGRLGKCEVCNDTDAKYTCPKCEVKTCCLKCSLIHKKELDCDGIRDPTKFIRLKEMTKMDFQSDYNFLEECTRYVEARKYDKIKQITQFNKYLPPRQFKLRNAARDRNITLRFLLPNFTRNRVNSSVYVAKSKVIKWRVEWIFTDAGNLKYVDERCEENEKISTLLDKYLNPDSVENVPEKKSLEFYQSHGLGRLKILLKAEGIKNCKNRFYRLKPNLSLKENLTGKTIVEFPVIYLIYNDHDEFSVIESDEDVETEAQQYREYLDDLHRKNQHLPPKRTADQDAVEPKVNKSKKRRKTDSKEPKNFLFANEIPENESLSSPSTSEAEEVCADTKFEDVHLRLHENSQLFLGESTKEDIGDNAVQDRTENDEDVWVEGEKSSLEETSSSN